MLHLHPKYKEIAEACETYPEEAEVLFQVYLDLTLEKEWSLVETKHVKAISRFVLEGKKELKEEIRYIVPTLASERWSLERIEKLFIELEKILDNKPSSVMLAITSTDSTVVYYTVHSGIVPPTS
ncbi:hypothetical protein K7432_013734 [Basidiobolus ranarum]|uniref:tRNA-splicing endonuclease subunit Sen15 domain-containing protein n=1 Tax=Basidiobolus ranarum TaxID=34480 RepID=A0ABR2WIR3_9FUNG